MKWWEKIAAEREPNLYIGGRTSPYMLRWYLVPRNDDCNIYLHKFIRDDEDRALHDHPWESFSVCLSGVFEEVTANRRRKIVPGNTRHRAATLAHRMIVVEQGFTLFITGPKIRDWGFLCPQGWRHWTRFTSGDQGEFVGLGCAEFGDAETEKTRLPGGA